jgi:arylsulfatase A-like enzyme
MVKKDAIAKAVKDYLDQRTSKKPLCLMVGDQRPHVAWTHEMIYAPDTVTLPSWFIDTPETRTFWVRYLSDVTGMDALMTQVDEIAKDHFGNEEYLFVYTSDHGAQWPFGKWNLYDHGIKVPFIVRWPGRVKANSHTSAMVSWIDLFPTLVDLAGGTVPQDIDGKSFLPVLLGNSDAHREMVFTTTTADGPYNIYPIRSVRTSRYKYIRNIYPDAYHSNHSDILRSEGAGAYWDSWDDAAKTDPAARAIIQRYYHRPSVEFYDLETDPEERVNLAGDPEYRAEIFRMSAIVDTWMKEQGDTVRMQRKPYTEGRPTRENVPEIKQREKKLTQ